MRLGNLHTRGPIKIDLFAGDDHEFVHIVLEDGTRIDIFPNGKVLYYNPNVGGPGDQTEFSIHDAGANGSVV